MKLTAFIPAKSNSRRLPNKNFRYFFGKTFTNQRIDETKKAELFYNILVSGNTNRPEYLLKDDVKIEEVLKYHIDNMDIEKDVDYICVIYPCAYAVTAEHLVKSFKAMLDKEKEYCYSCGMLNSTDSGTDNGGFYWVKTNAFLRDNLFLHKDALRYELPQVDINTFEDFLAAKVHVYNYHKERFLK